MKGSPIWYKFTYAFFIIFSIFYTSLQIRNDFFIKFFKILKIFKNFEKMWKNTKIRNPYCRPQ